MAKNNKNDLDNEEIGTILSQDAELSGTLFFEKGLQVLGKVSGEIIAKGLVVIEEGATVEAKLKAAKVIIRGSMKGDITASKKVEVYVSGKMVGNVTAPEVFLEPGCAFHGHCNMT